MKHKLFKLNKIICLLLIVVCFVLINSEKVSASQVETTTGEQATMDTSNNNELFGFTVSTDSEGVSSALKIVLVLTVLALCPSILVMLTSFTRILIVMHFTRSAIGTQTAPPNQILIGISLFLTIFIMSPVFGKIYTDAYVPLVMMK